MGFRGYKFRFELHASHSGLHNSLKDQHFHNFTIILYISNLETMYDELILYENIESHITQWMDQYQNRHLGDVGPFQYNDTTIESIGEIFFTKIQRDLKNLELELLRLEIFENPTRIYSVSEKILDNSVNELRLEPVSFNLDQKIEKEFPETDIQEEVAIAIAESGYDEVSIEPLESFVPKEKDKTGKNMEAVNNKYKVMKLLAAFTLLLFGAGVIMYIIKISGSYPRGSDTLCHIYRADFIYNSFKSGVAYPLYDSRWYNGVEIMRYWGPVPLYVLAFMEFFTNGNVLDAYILFIGLLVVLGGCGWLLFGWKNNRIGIAAILSLLWFLYPENIRVVITDGNLPRALISALVPFLLYCIWEFINEERWHFIISIIFLFSFIGLCHVGIAAMLLFSLLIFILIDSAYRKNFKLHKYILIGLFLSFINGGIWIVPSLHGGAVSKGESTNQVMKYFFNSVFDSLNPAYRMQGDLECFYYGISIFIIIIAGILLGNKKVKPGFLSALLIFFGTSKSAYFIFSNLPFSQFLWMIRFIPFSLAFAFMSFLMWKNLKKSVIGIMCILLILDTIPAYQYIFVKEEYRIRDVEASQYEKADTLSINEAKEITNQRMAVFDLSRYGSFAPYYIARMNPKVQYTFGAGWEGAKTATNIVQINSAFSGGNYYYLFDRCLELGNDTVLIPIEFLNENGTGARIEEMIRAGEKSGYRFVGQNNNSFLFHLDNDFKSFGTIVEYDCIAIGDSARSISLLFPVFKEGNSSNINDYTIEELRKYNKIYLSGFTYGDKAGTELMLSELAKSGIKIYIDMNKIPVNMKTNRHELFGVCAQAISFQEIYPNIHYKNQKYKPKEFSNEPEEKENSLITWNTVYLDGIKNIDGYCTLNDMDLTFSGTMDNPNIHFLGLNLQYHAQISRDMEIMKLLEEILEESKEDLPQRVIVPLDIEFKGDQIVIDSQYDNVNTSLSLIDIFHTEDTVMEENNLLVVNNGRTTIDLKYPYWLEGFVVSSIGIVFTIIFIIYIYKRMNKRKSVSIK